MSFFQSSVRWQGNHRVCHRNNDSSTKCRHFCADVPIYVKQSAHQIPYRTDRLIQPLDVVLSADNRRNKSHHVSDFVAEHNVLYRTHIGRAIFFHPLMFSHRYPKPSYDRARCNSSYIHLFGSFPARFMWSGACHSLLLQGMTRVPLSQIIKRSI